MRQQELLAPGALIHYVWHRSEQKNAALRLPPHSAPSRRPPRRGLSCLCFWPPRLLLRGEAVCGYYASSGRSGGRRRGVGFTVGSHFFFLAVCTELSQNCQTAVVLIYKDESGFGGAESVKQVRSRSNRLSDFFVCFCVRACVCATISWHQWGFENKRQCTHQGSSEWQHHHGWGQKPLVTILLTMGKGSNTKKMPNGSGNVSLLHLVWLKGKRVTNHQNWTEEVGRWKLENI